MLKAALSLYCPILQLHDNECINHYGLQWMDFCCEFCLPEPTFCTCIIY